MNGLKFMIMDEEKDVKETAMISGKRRGKLLCMGKGYCDIMMSCIINL